MIITLTPTQATLTANTVNGPVTVPLRRENRTPKALQKQYWNRVPRPRFVFVAPNVQQLTF